MTHGLTEPEFASLTTNSSSAPAKRALPPIETHHKADKDPRYDRDALLAAYRNSHRHRKEIQKAQEKLVIIENVRKRPPKLLLRETTPKTAHSHQHNDHHSHSSKKRDAGTHQRGHYFHGFAARFLPPQFLNRDLETERTDDWAAVRISRAMRRYRMVRELAASRLPQYLGVQCKKVFDECCKCTPLAQGPLTSEDGVYQIAGPNLPKILGMLRSRKNVGMDLLQPHGISQHTVTHVAAQRGYTELVRELLTHWMQHHPMESPYQPYSLALLTRLLHHVRQLRAMKTLVSESNSELRDIIAQIGVVSFSHVSDALDKLHEQDVTLADLIRICGHPLVLCKDAAGNTPLHYAAEGGYLSLCQLLIQHGAHINAQNQAGETPLHFAISSMHEDVCTYLVQRKADVSICRYVSLTLLNNVTIRGTLVEAPEGTAVCKVMPILHARSNAITALLTEHRVPKRSIWLSPWRRKGWRRRRRQPGDPKKTTATVTPASVVSSRASEGTTSEFIAPTEAGIRTSPTSTQAKTPNTPLPLTGNLAEDGMFTRVDSLASSSLFKDCHARDILYFRTAPGNSLMKAHVLCVLMLGEHVAASEAIKARSKQYKGKLFHLLIKNLPQVAVVAMDSFRTPLFRCSLLKDVRERNQRWILDNALKTRREKREALLVLMKGQQKAGKHRRKKQRSLSLAWITHKLYHVWEVLMRVRHFVSVQNVFATADADREFKNNIICEPKGILYEYVYDHAELRGGLSPTLALIIKTECKELLDHPWFSQIMDHKWNAFARQTFRREFHIYTLYFVSVFIATYLHVGDPYLGMPVGGYRSNSFTAHASWIEYFRDAARLVYSLINAHYTYEEFRSYREQGSIKAYLRDGWNWFDLVQITCVWMLFVTEIRGMFGAETFSSEDFELVAFRESYYRVKTWRRYHLRTTLMCIVGPQIFIKWIQFARGNRTLGPFVRMIFKMFHDIFVFLLVFCVFLLGFGFAFFILQLDGCRTYFSAIAMVLQISLGAWDWDAIEEGGPIAIMLFILYAIIGTIMLLNLLIAMLGNTYDKIWEDRLLFFELERAKATLSIQMAMDDDEYDERYWCQRLYVLEGDRPIEGIQFQKF
ncbi:hypothetical protein Poli38472_000607 [Pythium oligandrum]|uniref:Ion transport domain-containing protein n=1 Tax=Pythium oligandrum TaxID=41045 RepID=A0A8K1CCF3_PYTOL|nr:hypothetical protein Poli38472_000607 [Pythium oligandrum]|eukprot:TMW60565.1 hypothetical protein Poli38472_000607 [Pythium oligandrum]